MSSFRGSSESGSSRTEGEFFGVFEGKCSVRMSDYEFHRIAIHTHTIDVSDSVEEITEKLNKTGIDDGQSSSTSRTERIFIPSNSRDGNGRPAANMRPVAKRDLPVNHVPPYNS